MSNPNFNFRATDPSEVLKMIIEDQVLSATEDGRAAQEKAKRLLADREAALKEERN
jgi:hypothetical protein